MLRYTTPVWEHRSQATARVSITELNKGFRSSLCRHRANVATLEINAVVRTNQRESEYLLWCANKCNGEI